MDRGVGKMARLRAGCGAILAGFGLLAGPTSAVADYPERLIRIVVPVAPGGLSDATARAVASRFQKTWGQQVIIENRPGGNFQIGATAVTTAPPDGYTLLQATASYTINTALQTSQFDLGRDFAPVGRVSTSPFVLVVHPSVPVKTVAELIAYAKANPGKLNYASSGIGTPPHLAGELFKAMAGVDIVHVPFREANSGLNAVLGGSVQMMFSISSTVQSQLGSGMVRGIGVTTREPTKLVPGLPAVAQSGLPGFEVTGWNGYVAPKGTPQPILAKLNTVLRAGLEDADVLAKLGIAGYEPATPNSPLDFAKFIAADTAKWKDLVTKLNISAK
jgi:tripartite-type tricarboxylate transporter receptor subunit TctC